MNSTNSKQLRLCSIASDNGTYTVTIDGDFYLGTNTSLISNNAGRAGLIKCIIGGNFTVNGVLAGNFDFTGSNAEFDLSGNLILESTTSLTKGTGGTTALVFKKSGTQDYTNSSSVVLPAWDIIVNSGSTLNIADQLITGAANFTLNSGATLQTSHTNGVNENLTTSGAVALGSAANFIFYGTGSQATRALLTTAGSLTIANPVGVNLSTNVTTSILTINTSDILNIPASKQLTVSTTMTNNGILNLLSNTSNETATILTPASISGSGTTNVIQYLARGRNWYVSSPVSEVTVVVPSGLTFFGYQEDGTNTYMTTSGTTANWKPYVQGSALTTGKGNIAQPSMETILIFSGTLNVNQK